MKAVLLVLATIFSVVFGQLRPDICSAPGLVCSSCSELAICILAEGQYTIEHVNYCSANEKCTQNGCTTDLVPECDLAHLEFVCNHPGVYPDPIFCNKYHFCVPRDANTTETNRTAGLVDYPVTCDRGYGYNAITTYCSVILESNVCDLPVPLCEEPGQTGQLSNPSLYYVCKEHSKSDKTLYPFLYNCPHGGRYENYRCIADYTTRMPGSNDGNYRNPPIVYLLLLFLINFLLTT